MGRAAKRKTQQKTTRRLRRVTGDLLRQGWAGPDGSRIRLARPGEAAAVSLLLEYAGAEQDPQVGAAVDEGSVGKAVGEALDGARDGLLLPVARMLTTGETESLAELSLVLVAENPEEQLVGALLAIPPGQVMGQVVDAGVRPEQAAAAATMLVKIKGLAVAEGARGEGLGGALLAGCVQVYEQLGYLLMYGQFETGRGRLEGFYRRHGFDVLAEGEGIPMDGLFDIPFTIGAGPGFRVFARWR